MRSAHDTKVVVLVVAGRASRASATKALYSLKALSHGGRHIGLDFAFRVRMLKLLVAILTTLAFWLCTSHNATACSPPAPDSTTQVLSPSANATNVPINAQLLLTNFAYDVRDTDLRLSEMGLDVPVAFTSSKIADTIIVALRPTEPLRVNTSYVLHAATGDSRAVMPVLTFTTGAASDVTAPAPPSAEIRNAVEMKTKGDGRCKNDAHYIRYDVRVVAAEPMSMYVLSRDATGLQTAQHAFAVDSHGNAADLEHELSCDSEKNWEPADYYVQVFDLAGNASTATPVARPYCKNGGCSTSSPQTGLLAGAIVILCCLRRRPTSAPRLYS